MSAFEPQVPDSRDPNLPNIRPIQDIPANQSNKIALDTFSSGLTDAVNVVDTAIKKGIQDRAYDAVDVQRDAYTSGLEKIKGSLDQGVVPAPVQAIAGPTTGKSLLDANAMADEDDIPDGLSSGLDRINQLAAAKAAGSIKLNDTQYAMETLSVAKNLRATYGSGYRDYIDQEVSKASGLPVANSYYQNMLQDINRQLNQMGKTKDDIGALMMKNLDVPGIPGEIANRRAGTPKMDDAAVLSAVGSWQNLQTQYRIDAAARANQDATKADAIEDTRRKAAANFGNEVNLGLRGITANAGVPSSKELTTYLTDVSLGRHPEATQPEIDQRTAQLDAVIAKQRAALYAKGYEGGDKSIAAVLGPEAFRKTVDDALIPLTTFSAFAKDKESGPAFMVAHQNDAILQQDKNRILVNKDTGPAARQYEAVRSILGDGAFPDYMKSVAAGGFQDPLATLYTQEALSSISPIKDSFGQPVGAPRTMLDSIQHAKTVNVPQETGYYGKTVQRVEGLTNPKMPLEAKDALIKYSFDPKNRGTLDELNKDYKDPKTGQWVPGQYAAFNILSAPKITNAVKETAAAHPGNYGMYQDTVQEQFGKLYRSDIDSLNSTLQKSVRTVTTDEAGNPLTGATPLDTKVVSKKVPTFGFSYNSDTNNFGLVDNNNRPLTRESASRRPDFGVINGVLDRLEKINGGLSNLAYVYKSNPAGSQDVSEQLLRTLQTAAKGQPFGYTDGVPLQGATEGMLKAIIKAKVPETTPQDLANSVLNFAPKDSQDLAAWLRSPAGQRQGGPRPGGVIQGNLSDSQVTGMQTESIPVDANLSDYNYHRPPPSPKNAHRY